MNDQSNRDRKIFMANMGMVAFWNKTPKNIGDVPISSTVSDKKSSCPASVNTEIPKKRNTNFCAHREAFKAKQG